MKTERRHELQTNELASWLAKWIEEVKPYSKVIVGIVVMIATVSFAVAYVSGRNSRGDAEAWTAYFGAVESGDTEGYEQVSEQYPGTNAALWALQSAGDTALAAGAGQLFRDRDAANEDLERARDFYLQVVVAEEPTLKQRALFGLGQAYESLGEFTEAETTYRSILDDPDLKDSVAAGLADRRLEALKQKSTQEWYAWFDAQKPAESRVDTPGFFDNLPNLPNDPDLKMPKPGELLMPGGGATSVEDTADDDDDLGLPLFGPASEADEPGSTSAGGTDGPTLIQLPGDSPTGGTAIDLPSDSTEAADDPIAEESAEIDIIESPDDIPAESVDDSPEDVPPDTAEESGAGDQPPASGDEASGEAGADENTPSESGE